ncbi:MAG TPA: FdtA/QdtA family cupin domain-containing protein [Saprospiraceae bacterium]|nr:FdtA/QdtA family cupin domain-containing protein [Saprospiraceae bacterium]
MNLKPYTFQYPVHGDQQEGFLFVANSVELNPFEIKRVFWTKETPMGVIRGRHAHYTTELVLIAISGKIMVKTFDKMGNYGCFELDNPAIGLYLPSMCWHEMTYTEDAVQLALANSVYDESDYIRDINTFRKLIDITHVK